MERTKNFLIILFSLVSLGALGLGVKQALNSSLFTIEVIEVRRSVENPPLSDATVIQLAAVPVGKLSLYGIDRAVIRERLMAYDWIKEVKIQKKLMHTLTLFVSYREPKAIIQLHKGLLAYVDSDGKIFGSIRLEKAEDLPLLAGFVDHDPEKIKTALRMIRLWEEGPVSKVSKVSTLSWDAERGYRALVSYLLRSSGKTETLEDGTITRTIVNLGEEEEMQMQKTLGRLSEVFEYLSGNSIASRYVWADNGKKVVVKTAHGS